MIYAALFAIYFFGYWLGRRHGYSKGFDACDFEHDFDRCPCEED